LAVSSGQSEGANLRFKIAIYWIIGTTLFLAGCGTAHVNVHQNIEPQSSFARKVAVLPFTTQKDVLEKEKKPHEILREVFFNYFSYLGYTDMPLDEVDQKLREAGVSIQRDDPKTPSLSDAKLQEVLGVDAVVRGHILGANNFTGGIHSETYIEARLEMLDLHSGKLVWEVEHKEMAYSGIATPSFVDIVHEQMENAKTQQAYHNTAETFSIQVLRQLPDPAGVRATEVSLPEITALESNTQAHISFKPNDKIRVRMQGQPGLAASFDIGSWRTNIPMRETSPGRYAGSYQVVHGDNVTNAFIIGTLRGKNGLAGKRFYKAAMATIETPKEISRQNSAIK